MVLTIFNFMKNLLAFSICQSSSLSEKNITSQINVKWMIKMEKNKIPHLFLWRLNIGNCLKFYSCTFRNYNRLELNVMWCNSWTDEIFDIFFMLILFFISLGFLSMYSIFYSFIYITPYCSMASLFTFWLKNSAKLKKSKVMLLLWD